MKQRSNAAAKTGCTNQAVEGKEEHANKEQRAIFHCAGVKDVQTKLLYGGVCWRHGANGKSIVQNKTFSVDTGQMKRCSIEGYLTTFDLTNTND